MCPNCFTSSPYQLNVPDSPLEYPAFASEMTGLSPYNNLFHVFNDVSVWSARPTRK